MATSRGRKKITTTHLAFTQSHTFMFRGCRNMQALLTPTTPESTVELVNHFIGKLVESGLTVTFDPKTGQHDVTCRPFGSGFGITIAAILSGSDASYHTYTEYKFGRTAEVELNLCYLPGFADHKPAVRAVEKVFAEWLRPSAPVDVYNSRRRYLYPVRIARDRHGK